MLRLAKILAVVLLLAPLSASPLGLGDIRLQSALNQQFDAQIDVLALGQTRIDDISVRLASREAFERAGIERPLFLSRLQFDVEPGPGNTASIRIRTDQPVREPFLNFLVEVNWPSGRLLREYTVLLDPPLFLDESPSVIQAPAVSVTTAPAPVAAPAPRSSAAPAAAATGPVPGRLSASFEVTPDGAWSYGPVQKSDTLWSIAQEFRALHDASASTEQVMMALLRNNPEAFFNDNVNELHAGHVLRLDDPSMIALMSHAEAVAEARRQFAQWQDAKRMRAGAAAPRALGGDEGEMATTFAGASAGTSAAGPRLRLSAPADADAERFAMGDLGEGSQSAAATVSRLREDLVAALEVSESARQENLELRQRLAELEGQISSMQRLLSLQDDTMAAMQVGIGGVESSETEAVEDGAQQEATEEVAEAAETEAGPRPQAATPPAVVTPSLIPEILDQISGLRDTILEDPMMLGIAVFLVLMLLTLGWLIARRRRMAGATLDELVSEPAPEQRRVGGAATAAAVGAVAGATVPAAAESFEEAVQAADGGDDIGLDIMQPEEDEIDILAEADVYLAYRRFDKAEELLRDAIAGEPGRQDLVLKLFEVHTASGNKEAFVNEAQALQASLGSVGAGMWDKIVAMGRRIAPGNALFAAAAAAQAPDADAAIAEVSDVGGVELDFAAGMDLSDEMPDFTRDEPADVGEMTLTLEEAPAAGGDFAGLDMTLDDEALARLETGSEPFAGTPQQASVNEPAVPVSPSAVESADDDLEKQLLAAGSGEGNDVDWLSEIGNDLDFADMDGDETGGDFSGLISGEDEVGTKLDLARAYIDMGDQDSARSILNEVTEEGNEAQQREANDLIRRIG